MRAGLLIGFYLCAVPIAAAQDFILPPSDGVQTADSKDIAATGLTIYPDNLGFVRETRTIDVPAGIVDLRFFGVSDMIIPQSAVLESFEGLRLEGNFDSDLISPAKLLERSVGETVTIRRVNPVTGTADLVSAKLVSAAPDNKGQTSAIFSTGDGVEGYQCSGLAEALILSDLPDDLHSVPVLSTRVVSETAGPKEITLTYMTRGLGWSADYRMDVEKGSDEVGLLGWLTLNNRTSKRFEDADLSVVAGQVNQVREGSQFNRGRQWSRVANCVLHKNIVEQRDVVVVQSASIPASTRERASFSGVSDEVIVTGVSKAVVREATQEDLGDYKLYRAPQAVTVEPYQTKQIAFLSKDNVALETADTYKWTLSDMRNRGNWNALIKGRHVYSLDNSKDGNLAAPLPAGTVRAMSQTEDGLHVFMGEDIISNKAIGLPVELEIAESFLVAAQFYQVKQKARKFEGRIDVTNASDTAIIAEFDMDGFKDVEFRHGKRRKSLSKKDKVYTVTVPAESTVSFSIEAAIL